MPRLLILLEKIDMHIHLLYLGLINIRDRAVTNAVAKEYLQHTISSSFSRKAPWAAVFIAWYLLACSNKDFFVPPYLHHFCSTHSQRWLERGKTMPCAIVSQKACLALTNALELRLGTDF